jgi:hypothetical protein
MGIADVLARDDARDPLGEDLAHLQTQDIELWEGQGVSYQERPTSATHV